MVSNNRLLSIRFWLQFEWLQGVLMGETLILELGTTDLTFGLTRDCPDKPRRRVRTPYYSDVELDDLPAT